MSTSYNRALKFAPHNVPEGFTSNTLIDERDPKTSPSTDGVWVPDHSNSRRRITFDIPTEIVDCHNSRFEFTVRIEVPYKSTGTSHTTSFDGRPYFSHPLQAFQNIVFRDGRQTQDTIDNSDVVAKLDMAPVEDGYLQTIRSGVPAAFRAEHFPSMEEGNIICDRIDPINQIGIPPVGDDYASTAGVGATFEGGWKIKTLAVDEVNLDGDDGIKYIDIPVCIPLSEIHPVFSTGQIFPGFLLGSSLPTLEFLMQPINDFLSIDETPAMYITETYYDQVKWSLNNVRMRYALLEPADGASRSWRGSLLGLATMQGVPVSIEGIDVRKHIPVSEETTRLILPTGLSFRSVRRIFYIFKSMANTKYCGSDTVKPKYRAGEITSRRRGVNPKSFNYHRLTGLNVKIGTKNLFTNSDIDTRRVYQNFLEGLNKPGCMIVGTSSDFHLGAMEHAGGFGDDCFVVCVDLRDRVMNDEAVNVGIDTAKDQITVTMDLARAVGNDEIIQIAEYDSPGFYRVKNGYGSLDLVESSIATLSR